MRFRAIPHLDPVPDPGQNGATRSERCKAQVQVNAGTYEDQTRAILKSNQNQMLSLIGPLLG